MKIHIVADGNNRRGDTFTRLASDVFHSLGYEQLRFNIHQTGREVDIIGTHCTENRMMVAECKAHSELIGGDDLNKFAGILDAERRKSKSPVEGYYLSISGFKESAIQQERDIGGRFVMLGATEIAEHLIRGRIIVRPEAAVAASSRSLSRHESERYSETQIIAHETGWYWLVLYEKPGSPHPCFCIVHADGNVMQRDTALTLSTSIADLEDAEYVGPNTAAADKVIFEARSRYLDYLVREYGHITLEGLPADQETGAKKLVLENIYAPLTLEPVRPESTDDAPRFDSAPGLISADAEDDAPNSIDEDSEYFIDDDEDDSEDGKNREHVGKILADNTRLAVLASPGAGKTTLLKRLAVAYAVPKRLKASDDHLPEQNWLPLMIRCRHLGTDVSRPLLTAIENLAERAEMPELSNAFKALVMQELRVGKVLLLVDGLDEISSPADRARFVSQLRIFIGTYPSVTLIVTSREYGFRNVAGAVASLCTLYRVGELTEKDIVSITIAWHKEVLGSGVAIAKKARALAESILSADRVRRLAVNPLLLTTLLLVRRWLGELPRKRSLLYAKAIEVLLMTWNIEGHEPLDPDEVLPHLAFAAFRMMQSNVQVVSYSTLTEYLLEARRQMPDLLGYSRISVSEFITRVEERSSLLSLSGHVLEDGRLQATYEFKHLTFQEYLAALAAAHGYYPDRGDNERLVDVLQPYIAKQNWREVIPLAGVLGGRSSSALVEHMLDMSGPRQGLRELYGHELGKGRGNLYIDLVARCLSDDVPLVPDTLSRAIDIVLTQAPFFDVENDLLASRYGLEIYQKAKEGYGQFDDFVGAYGSYISHSYALEGYSFDESLDNFEQVVVSLFREGDPIRRATGYLWAMHLGWSYGHNRTSSEAYADMFARVRTQICRRLINERDPRVLLAGFWSLCWINAIKRVTPTQVKRLLPIMWSSWRESDNIGFQRQCAWTMWCMPILSRSDSPIFDDKESSGFLKAQIDSSDWSRSDRNRAALVMGYYLRAPWTDDELIDMLAQDVGGSAAHVSQPWSAGLLEALGPRGISVADEWRRSRRSRVTARKRVIALPRSV